MAFNKDLLTATTLLFMPVLAVSAQVVTQTQSETVETTTVTTDTAPDGSQVHYVTKETTTTNDPLIVVNVPHMSTTLRDYASTQQHLSGFANLLAATNLNVDLTGAETYTVFMPTNAAFSGLQHPAQQKWLAKPGEYRKQLAQMLNYHAVPGRITPADLAARISAGGGKTELTTLEGSTLYVTTDAKGIKITDERGMSSYVVPEPGLPADFPSALYRVGALFIPI